MKVINTSEAIQNFQANVTTPILTGSKTMIYEKEIDSLNNNEETFTVSVNQMTNSMNMANLIIELNAGQSSVKLAIEAINNSKLFDFTIPKNSNGLILEIYAMSNDANKGSMFIQIKEKKKCPTLFECNKCTSEMFDCQTSCRYIKIILCTKIFQYKL